MQELGIDVVDGARDVGDDRRGEVGQDEPEPFERDEVGVERDARVVVVPTGVGARGAQHDVGEVIVPAVAVAVAVAADQRPAAGGGHDRLQVVRAALVAGDVVDHHEPTADRVPRGLDVLDERGRCDDLGVGVAPQDRALAGCERDQWQQSADVEQLGDPSPQGTGWQVPGDAGDRGGGDLDGDDVAPAELEHAVAPRQP